MKKQILLLLFLAFNTLCAQEYDLAVNDTVKKLNEVVVTADALIGGTFKAKNIAGSTYFITPEEMKRYNYNDINRILKVVPGVNIVEEEGFGLRPSIGLRGTSPSRASKITLMEDGVLIAPATYSAPAAYYFPTVNRIQNVEILKGGSQIQYGPYTTGGAINLVSTQIPSNFRGTAKISAGSFNTKNTYFNLGDSYNNFAYLVEYNNRNSDGFKKIDFSNVNTGFNGNDYVTKLRWNTNKDSKTFQSIALKFQYNKEDSNETYLGLTPDDFNNNPYRRYLGSEVDNIATHHKQWMLTHIILPTTYMSITTKAYKNTFSRNWYKLDGVKQGINTISVKNILENPSLYSSEFNAITGTINSVTNALKLKANNRNYGAEGVQTVAQIKLGNGETTNQIELGARFHKDYEDRFQWVDSYTISNQKMLKTQAGIAGTDANRILQTEAFAAHALFNFEWKKFTFSPGVRFESILAESLDYGKNDVSRTEKDLKYISNKTEVWIPGFGMVYKFNPKHQLFYSMHKGFSPAGAVRNEINGQAQKPEESLNFELGYRTNLNQINAELIGYFNNYNNLQGADTNAAGGTGTGDLFNAGKAEVYGLETIFNYNHAKINNVKIPLTISYTFTQTALKSNFNSGTVAWGNIVTGDEIPYIPSHQLSFQTGFEYKNLFFGINAKYNSQVRTKAGQGAIVEDFSIPSNFVVDASLKYEFNKNLSIFSSINNLLDSTIAVARVPAGLRPAMPFFAQVGLCVQF